MTVDPPALVDPKLLDHSAVLACYEGLSNDTLTPAYRQAFLHEIFEHIDAQGRLLARAGNLIHKLRYEGGPEASAILAEIGRAMR